MELVTTVVEPTVFKETEKIPIKFDTSDLVGNEKIIHKDGKSLRIYKLPKGPKMNLPRYIYLTNDLAWAIGFFIAEGSKISSGIGIANQEIILIKKFKKVIEDVFAISNESWRAYIKTSDRNLEKVRSTWMQKMGISKTNVNFARLARRDVIELRLNNTLFSLVFNDFVRKTLPKILCNKQFILNFLDGYEVGDGSVIQRKGYLYSIVITVKDEFMKDFLVASFKRLYDYPVYIRRTKGSYEVQIRGVHAMTRLILDGHFKSYPKQWRKLITCYLKKEYPRSHIRYWTALSSGFSSISEIANKTKRSHWSVRDALNLDFKLGLVMMKRQHVCNKKAPYFKFYSLSTDGNRLVKILKDEGYYEEENYNPWGSRT